MAKDSLLAYSRRNIWFHVDRWFPAFMCGQSRCRQAGWPGTQAVELTLWARHQDEWFWVNGRMTEWVESCGDSDIVWLERGRGRRKSWGWSGGCQEEGRKSNWQRKRYKPCLPDVRAPWGASAVKHHADSLLVVSDENNTSLRTTPTSASALHM